MAVRIPLMILEIRSIPLLRAPRCSCLGASAMGAFEKRVIFLVRNTLPDRAGDFPDVVIVDVRQHPAFRTLERQVVGRHIPSVGFGDEQVILLHQELRPTPTATVPVARALVLALPPLLGTPSLEDPHHPPLPSFRHLPHKEIDPLRGVPAHGHHLLDHLRVWVPSDKTITTWNAAGDSSISKAMSSKLGVPAVMPGSPWKC